jgi:hypothetical protein
MTAIAIELDQKLQTFDPETAASVEKLVRDVLELAEKKEPSVTESAAIAAHRAHIARFAGIWAGDDFERPPQGGFEQGEDWTRQ